MDVSSVRLRLGLLIALLAVPALIAGRSLSAAPAPLARPLPAPAAAATPTITTPILFVTQLPIPEDFTTIGSVFGNHLGDMQSAGRGGDLWIRYPDGALKNLTAAAGYGVDGFQGAGAIAVRDPAVHWNGQKAVFSMVVGAPTQQYQVASFYWQLYEISGLEPADTPVIAKVPNQPEQYNNVSPIYGTDDRIIFVSDQPRNGQRHLYPQLDEYEEAPSNTGLWSLDPAGGDLFLLDHSPSGDFTPSIDSYGRVIFTRWDHLQRDQQADADELDNAGYGTFNYSDESVGALRLPSRAELFPEPRADRTDLLAGTNMVGHSFNQFFPWQVNEDGTELETLNHIGRHELHSYFDRSLSGDDNLVEFIDETSGRTNENEILNLLHIAEDPESRGRYIGVDAPEFSTHASGQIVSLSGAPTLNAANMAVTYLTHRDTAGYTPTPGATHSGLYRDPLPLAGGTLVAVHTPETDEDENIGPADDDGDDEAERFPRSRYDFRLKTLRQEAGYWVADQPLTSGISETISYWDPDYKVKYSGELWELNPVEVRARPRPARRSPELEQPEENVFAAAGVDPAEFQSYLAQNNLALVVSRDVTTRDAADLQQPFNLRVAGGQTQTPDAPTGKVYDVSYMQFFQGDQTRGIGGRADPRPGRRVLAAMMHGKAPNVPAPGAPAGSVKLGADGSMAALVPARRAMSWQLTGPQFQPVVRERYWLTFQPGEIRLCTSCHGLNEQDQDGQLVPVNEPAALRDLLEYVKAWRSATKRTYVPIVGN